MKINTCISIIEALTEWIGKFASWLVLAMVLIICYDVAMRQLFQQGSIALQELQWHFFAVIFLFGAAYTLKHNEHVRVDLLYNSRFVSNRQRAWINAIGIVLLLFPFCMMVLFTTWPFVANAFVIKETSPDPGGLPYRYLLKASILVAFALLLLQSIAELCKQILIIKEPS